MQWANGKNKTDVVFGVNVESDLKHLLDSCKANLKYFDRDLITRAFYYCVEGHRNKHRKSGEPYYTHPLQVAIIVVNEIPLDNISVVTALLHDVTKSDKYSIKDIESEFGQTVAELVDNISKIQRIESSNFEHIESYRKLLLSLFKDVRIILVKLADRLHNMRTLHYLPKKRQIEIAKETMEIFAPFANRFGLGNLKWELEDLAFKYLNPEIYNEIREKLALTRTEREEYLKQFTQPLEHQLANSDFIKRKRIKFEVSSRVKHIYSIHNKTIIRGKPLEELYDLYAVRIILDTDHTYACYLALGVLSELYKQVPETYKNYISNPKKNGYQSIHTAVIGPDGKLVEVQIRTRRMHLIAEKGVAAHFKYKPGFLPAESVFDDENTNKWMEVVRNIFENAEDEEPEKLMENVRRNLLLDEIYVITPHNEFVNLPKDSTPLDFAFYIHTEIGQHCIGAKVNGRVVPLNYRLNSGDRIEILTSKQQHPQKEWLDHTITHKARSSIHKYLKEQKKKIITEGKELWNRILGDMLLTIDENEFDIILDAFRFNSREEFYDALRGNEIDKNVLIEILNERIIEPDDLSSGRKYFKEANSKEIKKVNNIRNHNLKNGNPIDRNFPLRYAKCCYPVYGDHIVGMIENNSHLVIHRRSCKQIKPMIQSNAPGLFPLDWSWSLLQENFYDAKLIMKGEDDPTAINDLSSIFSEQDSVLLKGLSFDAKDKEFHASVTLGIKDNSSLKEIIAKILQLEPIKNVERYNQG
jgi:GTP diphosphokinase / guanosine-3',5'-bis(diphosphate) 3'-diphosphatase